MECGPPHLKPRVVGPSGGAVGDPLLVWSNTKGKGWWPGPRRTATLLLKHVPPHTCERTCVQTKHVCAADKHGPLEVHVHIYAQAKHVEAPNEWLFWYRFRIGTRFKLVWWSKLEKWWVPIVSKIILSAASVKLLLLISKTME